MSIGKIHFMYQEGKTHDDPFAKELIGNLGQSDVEHADTIVSIGGDGLLLRALRIGAGKKVFGLVSPGSNSVGFWTNKGIKSAGELTQAFQKAGIYSIKPLQADICFADGSHIKRYGYNDISIQPILQELSDELREEFSLSSIDQSMQSVMLKLSVNFSDATLGPREITGGGILFATALGSTAMNKSNGGPAENIRRESIILSGIRARALPSPICNDSDTSFTVQVGSPHKRPVAAMFDSFGIVKNEQGSPIDEMEISTAHDMRTDLMLLDHPGTRAYAEFVR